MQRAGLGYRELRKLRQLDSADRTIVIEAMGQRIEEDAGDKEAIKEAFAEMLETVQKRADKRVAELERGLDSMTREQSASNKVLADKEKKIRELHSALEATQEKPISPDQKVAAWAKQISDISDNAQYASTSSLGAIQILFKRIADEYERGNAPIPRPLQQAMGTAVQRLRAGVEALAEEFQLWGAMDEVLNAGSGGDDAWLQNQNGGLN
jgi:chromosome segregation ATPase